MIIRMKQISENNIKTALKSEWLEQTTPDFTSRMMSRIHKKEETCDEAKSLTIRPIPTLSNRLVLSLAGVIALVTIGLVFFSDSSHASSSIWQNMENWASSNVDISIGYSILQNTVLQMICLIFVVLFTTITLDWVVKTRLKHRIKSFT